MAVKKVVPSGERGDLEQEMADWHGKNRTNTIPYVIIADGEWSRKNRLVTLYEDFGWHINDDGGGRICFDKGNQTTNGDGVRGWW